MKIYKLRWLFIGVLFISSNGYALECDVDFRAKRIIKVSNWFGTVYKPEFKSGTSSGIGNNKKSCVRDALNDVKKDGWKITFQQLKSTN